MSDLLEQIKQLEDDLSWTGGYKAGRSASMEQIAALKVANQQLQAQWEKFRDERDLYRKQANTLWAALERIVDANGRDGRAIARGVMERLRRTK